MGGEGCGEEEGVEIVGGWGGGRGGCGGVGGVWGGCRCSVGRGGKGAAAASIRREEAATGQVEEGSRYSEV